MPLWTGEKLARAAGGTVCGAVPKAVTGISIDSRTLKAGDAFFAVKGERADGHAYAAAAAEKGAALLVAEAGRVQDLTQLLRQSKAAAPILAVENVMTALENAGRAARARLSPRAKVAAITGSVGKTTVKEMLARLLMQFGAVHYSPASFNNHFGVPLTLARMPQETDFAVFEIGMSHAGEITPLTDMVRPHLALITRIAAAHMGHFNSLEEIAAAKAEIFSGLEPEGAVLLNADDAQYEFLLKKAKAADRHRIYSFGRSKKADYHLAEERLLPHGQEIAVSCNGGKPRIFRLNARGAHMAENACAVAASFALLAAGGKKHSEAENIWRDAARELQKFKAGAGRGARYRLSLTEESGKAGNFELIDESYNANPLSMKQALQLLADADVKSGGRRIAVLGDMLELGAGARQAHEALAEQIAAGQIDIIVSAGENMRFLYKKLQKTMPPSALFWQKTAAGLAEELKSRVKNGDAVMVKGSNSVGLGAEVKELLGCFKKISQA